jgi:hypothetical protein
MLGGGPGSRNTAAVAVWLICATVGASRACCRQVAAGADRREGYASAQGVLSIAHDRM